MTADAIEDMRRRMSGREYSHQNSVAKVEEFLQSFNWDAVDDHGLPRAEVLYVGYALKCLPQSLCVTMRCSNLAAPERRVLLFVQLLHLAQLC